MLIQPRTRDLAAKQREFVAEDTISSSLNSRDRKRSHATANTRRNNRHSNDTTTTTKQPPPLESEEADSTTAAQLRGASNHRMDLRTRHVAAEPILRLQRPFIRSRGATSSAVCSTKTKRPHDDRVFAPHGHRTRQKRCASIAHDCSSHLLLDVRCDRAHWRKCLVDSDLYGRRAARGPDP
jgi:hypothetical protein